MNGKEEISGKQTSGNGKSLYKLPRLGVNSVVDGKSSGGEEETRKNSFLPIAIMFNILILLPADVLRKVMMLVCKDWYNIINDPQFVEAHLHMSATGLVVGNLMTLSERIVKSLTFVEIKECAAPHLPRSNDLVLATRCNKYFIDCCDGLILIEEQINDGYSPDLYHVVNPASKQKLTLSPPAEKFIRGIAAITRARSSSPGEYKVVLTGVSNTRQGPRYQAFISTINGDDNRWRCICLGKKVPTDIISVGGFVYWHRKGKNRDSLALDVETEEVLRVERPDLDIVSEPAETYQYVRYIKSERFIILPLISSYLIWEFLALVDPRNGEWKKLFEINLRDKQRLIQKFVGGRCRFLEPRLVMFEKDLVVFSARNSECFVGYKLTEKSIFKFGKIEPSSGVVQVLDHKKTLVPIKG